MRKNTGPKIIIIADVLFVLSIVLLVLGGSFLVAGLVVLLMEEEAAAVVFIAALSMLGAALSLYITNLFVRGYGEIVRNSNQLCDKLDLLLEQMADPADSEQSVFDEVCNAVQDSIT